MHDQSLPPSDRAEQEPEYLTGDALRAAVEKTKFSNAQLAGAIGSNTSYVSQWKNRKFPGADEAGFERRIREWLRDRSVTVVSGVPTIDTEFSKAMIEAIEATRRTGELALILAPPGFGKSRGLTRYLLNHELAITFRARTYRSGMRGITAELLSAAEIIKLGKRETQWDAIIDRTKGSGRLLIVDDAHELSQRALQCCVDWHEDTGNPVVLIGMPELRKKLARDVRRARRVDDVYTLGIDDPTPLVSHLVSQLAPDANGERKGLIALGCQVARRDGAFGAVEKQLKKAATIRKKKATAKVAKEYPQWVGEDGCYNWTGAFIGAHSSLIRSYTLDLSAN